jgi:hypothetical protein
MAFRSIGDLAIEVLAGMNGEPGTRGSAVTRAYSSGPSQRRDAANEGGDQSCAGEDGGPVAFARLEGAAQTGMKGGGANPPSLLPVLVWTNPDRVTMHGRAVTAATGSPIPAARPYLVALNGVRVHSDHPRRVKQIEHAEQERHSQ